LNKYNFLMNF